MNLGSIRMLNVRLEVIAFDRALGCRLKYASVSALSRAFCDGFHVRVGRPMGTGTGFVFASKSICESAL